MFFPLFFLVRSGYTIFSIIKKSPSASFTRTHAKRLVSFYCPIWSGTVKRWRHFMPLPLCINCNWNRYVRCELNICHCCGIYGRRVSPRFALNTDWTRHNYAFICIISHRSIIYTYISPIWSMKRPEFIVSAGKTLSEKKLDLVRIFKRLISWFYLQPHAQHRNQ